MPSNELPIIAESCGILRLPTGRQGAEAPQNDKSFRMTKIFFIIIKLIAFLLKNVNIFI